MSAIRPSEPLLVSLAPRRGEFIGCGERVLVISLFVFVEGTKECN
jgi:hypothetical protein